MRVEPDTRQSSSGSMREETFGGFSMSDVRRVKSGLSDGGPRRSSPRIEPVVSVILPVLNGAATIDEQLAALHGQDDPGVSWELVVVDNGSTDNTARIVERWARCDARVRLVEANRQHNLAYARNVGVDAARGSKILFCDADDVVGGGWLAAASRALDESALIAFAFEYDRLNSRRDLFGRARYQSSIVEKIFDMPVVSGAMGVRREVWDAVNGNDERWHFTGEDFDFALRVRKQLGVEPAFAAEAVYHCRVRNSPRMAFRQARRYGRAHVALFARYVEHPPRVSRRARDAARDWWWIVSRSPLRGA